jgi:MinD-like ATPase involved in chromosome partitioning or flagellar assembly
VQDNGQNPNADAGRANGQRQVTPEEAQESATGWPGVQDIPSPSAERVAPWSAEHFESQPGWTEERRQAPAPTGWPATPLHAVPAAPEGAGPERPGRHTGAEEPYVGHAPSFPYGGTPQYSDQPAAAWQDPRIRDDEPDLEQTTQYQPAPGQHPEQYPAEHQAAEHPQTELHPADQHTGEHYPVAQYPQAEQQVEQHPAEEYPPEQHPADPHYPGHDPYAPPPQYPPQVHQHVFPPRPEQQHPQYDPAAYPQQPEPQPGYPQHGYQGHQQGYQQPPPPPQHPQTPPQPAQPMAPPPTAEEFAARRAHKPRAPEATMGVPALIRRVSFGMVAPAPSRKEREYRDAIRKVRRNFGGLRQITVVNPKGGAGKTVAALMIAMTFGQSRGGYVLAWDNNETQGTLGMRAQQDFHTRTVRDVLHDLATFMGVHGRVGDLSSYVRAQGEAMFDVLASDESATAGEMLTARAFADIREVVSRFYKLIIVDTGNNVRAENWQASIDATDQLVVTMSARGDSAETAARMLDHLEQTGRDQLVRQAVTVVTMPASSKGVDLPAIQRHFAARTRQVIVAPYERLLDSGEPIRYGELSQDSKDAWLKIAAAIAEGL